MLVLFFYYLWKNNTDDNDLTPFIHWKQILLPYLKCDHYCLYIMNRYKKSVQIIDSLGYGKKQLRTFNSFHYDIMTIVSADFTWKHYLLLTIYYDMIKGACYNDLALVLTQMKRMEEVLLRRYGEAAYFASKQPNWVQLAKKRTVIKVPTQGNNQCGFYMLQYAYHFDGDRKSVV